LVTYLRWTLIYEWWVVTSRSNNGNQKTCLKEIGLSAQKLLTILGSIVNIIWGERGGGPMWPSNGSPLWTLKIHINLRLDPKLSKINPDFFKFVRLTCGLEYNKTFR
jgi:hypothetical protein